MTLQYRFSVDTFNERNISGWCYYRLNKRKTLKLQLWEEEKLIIEITNNQYREDLKAQKVHPTGRCGFSFVFPENFKINLSKILTITAGKRQSFLCKLQPQARLQVIDQSNGIASTLLRWVQTRTTQAQPSLLFMHIPKTAGTTFNSFARTLFPERQVISHIESYEEQEYELIQSRYRFISGHIGVGAIKRGFNLDQVLLYSVVREPYHHLHSHLNWIMKVALSGDVFFQQHNDFFRALSEKYKEFDFGDTEALKYFVESLTPAECRIFENCQCRYFLDHSPDRVLKSDLAKAIENVKLFEYIGLTEKYSSFESAFEQAHNGRKQKNSSQTKKKKLNKSRLQPLFDVTDPKVRSILRPLVAVDVSLYDYIQRKYYT